MSDADRAFARLVAADPALDLIDHPAPPDRVPEWSGPRVPIRPDRGPSPWRPVAAVAAIVMVVTVSVLALDIGGRRPVATTDPVETVVRFFEHWNEGEVDEALALVHPDVVVNGRSDAGDLQDFMTWTLEFDGTMAFDCVAAPRPATVSCDWSFVEPAVEALGLPGAAGLPFAVGGRGIESLVTPDYSEFETRLAALARERDPEGFIAACRVDGDAASSLAGFSYTPACGAFLARLSPALVDSLGSG